MRINLELAEVLMDALRLAGYDCGIAGGYARDTFFGLEPKDADIMVAVGHVEEGDEEQLISKLSDLLFRACYENKFAVERKVMGMYNDTGQDRVCGVVQYKQGGIDVVFYRDCETICDIVNAFDFNINQFGMDGKHDNIPVYCGTTDLRTLVMVRADSSDKRRAKVLYKYRDLLPAIERAYSEGRLV